MNDIMRIGEALLLGNGEEKQRNLLWVCLLDKQIEKYTHGESSSVPLETAGSLLRSILYTAAQAHSGGAGDQKTPETLYEEGKVILSRKLQKARRLYYLVKSTMLPVDSPCYREAVETGIAAFFHDYDMEFAAQETPGDFDYPASMPSTLTGVAWVLHFLDCLYWENVFCRRFPKSQVEGTLKAHGILGTAIPVNVFEPVFAVALHGYLLNRGKTSSLVVHPADNKQIVQSLAHLSQNAVFQRAKEACEKMMEDMDIKSASFRALLAYQAQALAGRLAPALTHGDASGVFPPLESAPPPVLMMDGDPMDGEEFRALVAELSDCRYFSDKLMLIRRQAHSLYDLTGFMEGGCFSLEEMVRLFSMLGRMELAGLLRMGRGGLLFGGCWVFPDTDAALWGKCLYGYLESLGLMRRKEITDIAGRMQMAT